MMFDFTMLTPDAKTIDCSISSSAMDRLSGVSGYMRTEREELFSELRDKIDYIASDIFDREKSAEVIIFSKHVERYLKKLPG